MLTINYDEWHPSPKGCYACRVSADMAAPDMATNYIYIYTYICTYVYIYIYICVCIHLHRIGQNDSCTAFGSGTMLKPNIRFCVRCIRSTFHTIRTPRPQTPRPQTPEMGPASGQTGADQRRAISHKVFDCQVEVEGASWWCAGVGLWPSVSRCKTLIHNFPFVV